MLKLVYKFIKFSFPCVILVIGAPTFAQVNLDTLFSRAKVTGVQLTATANGKTSQYSFGKRRSDENIKINDSSIFQAASLSKTVLAYITMRLYDKKIIELDTPLFRYYRYERIKDDTDAQKITARMVLHHVSGLPNWGGNPLAKEWHTTPLKTKTIPGTGWSYSGEGFMFLQFTLEHLVKQPLEAIAQKEVFQPLKMKSSSFVGKPSFEQKAVYGHDKTEKASIRVRFFDPAGAYSLLTSASDFTKFLTALVFGEGLTKKSHQLLLNDRVSVKKRDGTSSEAANHIFWGLGIGIQENEIGKAIWHWGDNEDFKCFFMVFPAKKKGIAYFTNSANGFNPLSAVLTHYFGKGTWWALEWLDKDF